MGNTALSDKYKFFTAERVVLFIILLGCFISYFQITTFDFLFWDDDAQITKNVYVRNLDIYSLKHNYSRESFTFLTLTVYSVLYKIWGNNPAPFHWLSLIIHLLNILLLFKLLKYFTKNLYAIGLVLLLFALHPMRVESVAWISELKDLLFTFFSIISFLFYFKYLKSNYNLLYFVLAVLMVVLASLSKIQGVAVPLSFLLIDIYCRRKFSARLVIEKILIVVILLNVLILFSLKLMTIFVLMVTVGLLYEKGVFKIRSNSAKKYLRIVIIGAFAISGIVSVFFLFTSYKFNLWSETPDSTNTFSFFERILLAGYSLWFYIKSLFFPLFLSAVHPYPIRLSDGGLPAEYYMTLFFLVIVIALSILMVIKRKMLPAALLFGWFFFLVNISMVLHIIPIEGRLVVADRYSYLAYLGLFISLASLGEKYIFIKKNLKNVIVFVSVFMLLTLSFLTYSRCKVWKNTKTLFTDVISKNPKIPFAYCSLAAYHMSKSLSDSAIINFDKALSYDSVYSIAYYNRAFAYLENKNYKNAISDFNSFLRLMKSNSAKAQAYDHLGKIYRILGNDTVALKNFNLAIENDPKLSTAYNNRGIYFLNLNKITEAVTDFKKAVELNVYYSEAYNNLGTALMSQGDMVAAERNFNRSIFLDPTYRIAYDNRGYLKYLNGDAAGAIKDYNKEIELDPTFLQPYIKRGRAYAQMKNYQTAIGDFNYVLGKDPNNMTALTNRAYAYFYINENSKAEIDFKNATQLYPENSLVWQNLAWFHLQLKNYQKAINEYLLAIEKDNKASVAYVNLGWIYIELKEYENADEILKASLLINPENSESIFLLGELNRKKGKDEKSCEYYKKAADLGNVNAKNALNSFCSRKK